MTANKEVITAILEREVTPATGCTEPSAVGVAVALAFNAAIGNLDSDLKMLSKMAAEAVVRNVKKVMVKTDRNVFKNCADVGIPNTNGRRGERIAAAMALFSDPSLKLTIFDRVDPGLLPFADKLAERVEIYIEDTWTGEPDINIDAVVETEKGSGHAVIKHAHTNVLLVEGNGRPLHKSMEGTAQHKIPDSYKEHFRNLTIDELIEYVRNMPAKAREIAEEGIKINTEISTVGIKKSIGIGAGHILYRYSVENNDLTSYIKARTAAAADARMFGGLHAVMAVAGSGNMGITATMPIVAYAEKKGFDEELLIEAVVLSYLLTIYITYHSSYLSAACGCATKAGVGAAAGLTYYMCRRDNSCCKRSIQNFIANTTGMICDGAKYGCALKVATAVDATFQSALLALNGKEAPYTNGVLGKSAEESIRNMSGVIRSMTPVDRTIVTIMSEK